MASAHTLKSSRPLDLKMYRDVQGKKNRKISQAEKKKSKKEASKEYIRISLLTRESPVSNNKSNPVWFS